MAKEIKKYYVEIYGDDNPKLPVKLAYLRKFNDIELLFKDIVDDNEFVEFSSIMRRNDRLYDRFDNVDLEDFNIIEITAIKKVKKYDI